MYLPCKTLWRFRRIRGRRTKTLSFISLSVDFVNESHALKADFHSVEFSERTEFDKINCHLRVTSFQIQSNIFTHKQRISWIGKDFLSIPKILLSRHQP